MITAADIGVHLASILGNRSNVIEIAFGDWILQVLSIPSIRNAEPRF
jgi:hypothetical protein